VILGNVDYERLLGDNLQKTLKEALFVLRTLVFIGCGEGLRDRSVAPVLQFIDRLLPPESGEHFQLVVGSDLRAAIERPLGTSVVPIAYGERHKDLAGFIEALATGKTQIDVSQDPAFYERRSRGGRRGFLDVAAPAETSLAVARNAIEDRATVKCCG
jgi:hypothetical protein